MTAPWLSDKDCNKWNCVNPPQCLEHRHSFVRRNAVLAINALYKLPKGEMLLQDAPELIEKVLQVSAGPRCRRTGWLCRNITCWAAFC